jgi:hypothetical protein
VSLTPRPARLKRKQSRSTNTGIANGDDVDVDPSMMSLFTHLVYMHVNTIRGPSVVISVDIPLENIL